MNKLTIVLLSVLAAGFAAYNIIYSGVHNLYKGDRNG